MTYFLAVCAAFCAAVGAAIQHREVADVPEGKASGFALVLSSFRRPMWWLGMGVLIIAPVFQFLALKVGSLAQVQPTLTTELLFLLVIIVITHHHRPGVREWTGAIGIVVGLTLFLGAAHPHGGRSAIGTRDTVWLGVAVVAILSVFLGLSRLWTGWKRAALLGGAAATCFAYQAAMTKIVSGTAAGSILTSPALYVLAVAGALGFYLFQHALRAGHVAASRASMNIVNPILSVIIGVVAFNELLSHSPGRIALEVLGLAVLLFGAGQLASSPLITRDPEYGDGGETVGAAPL